jgi:hypothetical protein
MFKSIGSDFVVVSFSLFVSIASYRRFSLVFNLLMLFVLRLKAEQLSHLPLASVPHQININR